MPEGMMSYDAWPLASQTAIDECAEALFVAGYPTDVHRGHDTGGAESRWMQINLPEDSTRPLTATSGQVVVLLLGKPQVLDAAQYAAAFPAEPRAKAKGSRSR